MVDNFALFVSQLMMIVVLWRCFTLPDSDSESDNEQQKPAYRAKIGRANGDDKGAAKI